MDYQKEYELLKEKIIEKYDYWFSKFVLEDIIDVGEVDYLIGNDDELVYNQDLAIELKDIITSYINEDTKTYNIELAIKFIELKKITDKRIINSPEYNYKEVYKCIFDEKIEGTNKSIKQPSYIKLNPNLSNSNNILKETYTFLKKNNYIENTEDEFISHFKESFQFESKINWTGSNQISLVGFINLLFDKDIIPHHKKRKLRTKILLNHFTFNNKPLNKGSIKTLSSKTYETRLYKVINDFFVSLEIDFN
ncbi:hypothetical protein [Tenacibaculum mesophilum]|uniref:hypothetical protein n=1 Tax=Tenacibaculum mesophilum TaxID=104268 RepID=UPI002491AAC5|nr:hypothetical protein [Tenacibaculum mesophilum]